VPPQRRGRPPRRESRTAAVPPAGTPRHHRRPGIDAGIRETQKNPQKPLLLFFLEISPNFLNLFSIFLLLFSFFLFHFFFSPFLFFFSPFFFLSFSPLSPSFGL
jgi:hypothetical protein